MSISNGSLASIEANAFADCSNVTSLSLAGSNLEIIHSFAFTGLESLRGLDLSNLHIYLIHHSAFYGLSSLRILHLSANSIVNIVSGTFNNLPSIEVVDLSNNPLSFIQPNAFDTSPTLQQLILDDTNLRTLDRCIFGQSNPRNISLTNSNSPFTCNNDELCWIVDGVNNGWIQSQGSLVCIEEGNPGVTHAIRDRLNCLCKYASDPILKLHFNCSFRTHQKIKNQNRTVCHIVQFRSPLITRC